MAHRLASFSTMNRKLAAPVVNAVVLRVARPPGDAAVAPRGPTPDCWSLPGGFVREGESLDERDAPPPAREGRRRATSGTSSSSTRHRRPTPTPSCGCSTSRYLALHPARRRARRCRPTPSGTRSTRCRRSRSATPTRSHRAHERLRGKLSYSNVAFALAPRALHAARARRGLRGGARLRRRRDAPAPRARARRPHRADRRRGAAPAGGRPRSSVHATTSSSSRARSRRSGRQRGARGRAPAPSA